MQCLSGRVLNLRSKGRLFKPRQRHCVVSLSRTHYSLLSTVSMQKICWHDWKIVDSDLKHQLNQPKLFFLLRSQNIMCQCQWVSNQWPLNLKSNTLPLSHCSTKNNSDITPSYSYFFFLNQVKISETIVLIDYFFFIYSKDCNLCLAACFLKSMMPNFFNIF